MKRYVKAAAELTDEQIKNMISTKLLRQIDNYPLQTVLRRVLYYNVNKIDWQDFYQQILEQMPEFELYNYDEEGNII